MGAAHSVTMSPILTQVMKIIMTLTVEESGRVRYIKRPGALLEAGCVIARLELDDPTKVKPVSLPGDSCAAVPSKWTFSGDKTEELPWLGHEQGCVSILAQSGACMAMLHPPAGCIGAQVAAVCAVVLLCIGITCVLT